MRRFLAAPVEDWIGATLFFLLLVLMSVNVFARYVLNTGIGWSEEISRYLLVWIVYVGLATGIRKQSHVRVDLIDRLVGIRGRKILAALNTLILLVFLVSLCWIYWDLIGKFARLRSPASDVSMGYAYAAIFFGAAAGLLRLLIQQFERETDR